MNAADRIDYTQCPQCGSDRLKVDRTGPDRGGECVRWRRCRDCGYEVCRSESVAIKIRRVRRSLRGEGE